MSGKKVDASKILHNIHIWLYLQFFFYWGTIAMGMVVNYYYQVPGTLQPTATSILTEMLTSPLLLAHGLFAVLSTGMSIPIIPAARKLGLNKVSWLHVAAISVRSGGFIGGPLFIYYSTQAVSLSTYGNVSSFIMASVFMIAVTLTFLSRIFVYREDVLLKYGLLDASGKVLGKQHIGAEKPLKASSGLSLPNLKIILNVCYLNFVVYLFLYFTGMYINIWITSGVNTINIGDPTNILHMILTTLNFGFSFFVMIAAYVYGMRRAAFFSFGALASISVSSVGGLLFLATGGGRATGSLTLVGGWVMSLIFMLAFFLAYYATLDVVQAITMKQIFGEGKR